MYNEIIAKYIHDGINSLSKTEIEILDNEFEKDNRISFETKEKIRSEIKLFRRQEKIKRNQFKEKVSSLAEVYFEEEVKVAVSQMEGKYYGFVFIDDKIVASSILNKGEFVENINLKLKEQNK